MTFRAVACGARAPRFPAVASRGARAAAVTNLDTVSDATQVTGLHVDLPKPDCASFPSDCADIAVLDTLDGFNIQPRISIPFSGDIDLSTVNSSNIFLVGPGGHVGINQAVWEPLTHTLHVESDQQLAEAMTYLLVVKRDARREREASRVQVPAQGQQRRRKRSCRQGLPQGVEASAQGR
jgi:hypothetical protein